jgi:hypothetical protein
MQVKAWPERRESVQVRAPLPWGWSMLEFCRNVVRFFADCIESLRDDDVVVERYEARQQRWLDYLRS